MARSKGFDDVQVVRAARDLFWQHGYPATSLAQLQTATGLNKSSLYQTYGSKRGLFDRALQSYLDEVIDALLGPLEAPGAGKAELLAYFRTFAAVFRCGREPEASRGCFMVNTAVELNELDASAVRVVNQYRVRAQAAFANARHRLRRGVSVEPPRADVLAATQIGMMVTSRMDPLAAADLADEVAAEIERWDQVA